MTDIDKIKRNIADMIDPLTPKTTDRIIKIITVGLTISYLIYFINNWGLTSIMLQDFENWDISSLEYFAPLILFPIGLYGFWTIKKYGWTLVTVMLTYLTVTIIFVVAFEVKLSMNTPMDFDTGGQIAIQPVDNSAFDKLFGRKGIVFYIGQLFIMGGFLFSINRTTITEKFKINRRTQLLAIGLTAIPFMLFGLTMLT